VKCKRVINAKMAEIDNKTEPDYEIFDLAAKEAWCLLRYGPFRKFKELFTPEDDIPDIRDIVSKANFRNFFQLPRFLPALNQGLKNLLVFITILGGMAEIILLGSSFTFIAIAAGIILRIISGPRLDPFSYAVHFGLAPLVKRIFNTQSSYIEDPLQRWREAVVLIVIVFAIVLTWIPAADMTVRNIHIISGFLAALLSLVRATCLDWCPVIGLVECISCSKQSRKVYKVFRIRPTTQNDALPLLNSSAGIQA